MASNPKRQPTLADKIQWQKRGREMIVPDAKAARLVALVRDAQKFVLTEEATTHIGNAIAANPEYLIDNGQFAIPPHETCWIEFPALAMQMAIAPESITRHMDTRSGYLFHKGDIYVASIDDGEERAAFSPLSYRLNREMDIDEEIHLAEVFQISRGQLDEFMWGRRIWESLGDPYRRALRNRHTVSVNLKPAYSDVLKGIHGHFAGDLRTILGILLALNQPKSVVRLNNLGHHRQLTSRGNRVFMAHNVVEIDLLGKTHLEILRPQTSMNSTGIRWHRVRGHFCHNPAGRSKKCIHDWVETRHHRWECQKCVGKRWWREYPEGHGDASKGMSLHSHLVKG